MASLISLISDCQQELRRHVEYGNINGALEQINNGADPNYRYKDGAAIIHIIAERNQIKMFKEIIKTFEGLKINMKHSQLGVTALMISVFLYKTEMVVALLEENADPNILDNKKQSALHYSTQRGDIKITQILLRYGANSVNKNIFDNTPLSQAVIEVPNLTITFLLLQFEYSTDYMGDLFLDACLYCNSRKRKNITMLLIHIGRANINYQHRDTKKSCLHILAMTNYVPLAVSLLREGADVNLKDIDNRLAIDVANEHRNVEMYSLLTANEKEIKSYSPLPATASKKSVVFSIPSEVIIPKPKEKKHISFSFK